MARVPTVMANTRALDQMRSDSAQVARSDTDAKTTLEALEPSDNPALTEWLQKQPR